VNGGLRLTHNLTHYGKITSGNGRTDRQADSREFDAKIRVGRSQSESAAKNCLHLLRGVEAEGGQDAGRTARDADHSPTLPQPAT